MKKPLIVIGGPTACGKTGFSIRLAKEIGGEVISADSMQIYRYMDIGTAKVTPEEADGVPHYLIDELNPDEEYNVMLFQQKAKAYMEEIWAKGKIPILVGGTGFYINALLYDNDFTETENDTSYREECYRIAKEEGPQVLYERLRKIDPAYAETIHANNVKRVTRALEYHYLTGQRFSEHNAEQKERETPYNAAVILLTMEREALYARIEQRIDLMMQQGLLAEVKGLLDRGYSPKLVSMQGIGYKEFVPYFNGDCTLDEAVTQLKTNTRRFAKRQLTWFRRQIEGLWIDMSKTDGAGALAQTMTYLKERGVLQTNNNCVFYDLQLSGMGNGINVCFYQCEKMGESRLYQWSVLPHLRHRRTADSSGTEACFGFDFAAVSGRLCDCNRCGISHRADIGKAFPCHMVGLFPKAL